MKFVTFLHNNRTQLGEIVDDEVYVLSSSDTVRMTEMIRRGVTPNRVSQHYPLVQVKLLAPLRPGKIIAIGRNYAEHAKETGNKPPTSPMVFAKMTNSVLDPGEAITWRESITKEVDWEVELAVIIGKKATRVSEEDALKYVFGYTIGNDVSARDLQLRSDGRWVRGKGLDTFCPLGPVIVTPDEIPDPQNLNLKTTVNDEVMQDGNTKDMIFSTLPDSLSLTVFHAGTR
jgi:2-keto-4-pentenoate hydratase/2-oxohepta-3-ene-1,7-dioic acid hydratase in catechol pathway